VPQLTYKSAAFFLSLGAWLLAALLLTLLSDDHATNIIIHHDLTWGDVSTITQQVQGRFLGVKALPILRGWSSQFFHLWDLQSSCSNCCS